MPNNSTLAAVDRYFRKFHQHCVEPSPDTLFELLNALHSLNDKLRAATGKDLFASSNFTALKALRNLFHHETELLHHVKIIPSSNLPMIVTDLLVVCLVEKSLIDQAARGRQVRDPQIIMGALKWYGEIANIQPCILNCAVDVYETVEGLDLLPISDEFAAFKLSYDYEKAHGIAHYVAGDIMCHASDVAEVLAKIFQQPPNG